VNTKANDNYANAAFSLCPPATPSSAAPPCRTSAGERSSLLSRVQEGRDGMRKVLALLDGTSEDKGTTRCGST